jgi:uncharacterized membrane protein
VAVKVLLLVSAASVFGAVLWRVMGWPPGNIGHVAGLAMILSATVVAAEPWARVTGAGRVLLAAVGVCVISSAAEISGLYWGFFGEYEYLANWKPGILLPGGLHFPLLLPVVWFVILASTYAFTRQRLGAATAVPAAALLATLGDLFGEAVLTGPVGFWVWLEPTPLLGAPPWNWLGWLITALAGCTWLAVLFKGVVPRGQGPKWMIVATMLGMAVIGGTHGEPHGLLALLLVPPVLAWPSRPALSSGPGIAAVRSAATPPAR